MSFAEILPWSDENIAAMFALDRKNLFVRSGDVSGKVRVDGRIKGNLHGVTMLVGPTGAVEGDIYAEHALIYGEVRGGICARTVWLYPGCKVQGVILSHTLSVEPGASLQGSCRTSGRA